MSTARVIRKYPNRRLYDTEESRYITLADVGTLVVEKAEFVIIDKTSGDDITRTVLLQVIAEKEQQGVAIMTPGFLSQVIRSYGAVGPGLLSEHLEQSLALFLSQQQRSERGEGSNMARGASGPDTAKSSLTRWRPLQEEARGPGGALESTSAVQEEAPAEQKKAS